MPPIKVLVVDNDDSVRERQTQVLETTPDLCVVAEAATGIEAVKMVSKSLPELIMIDANLPILDGIDTASLIKKHFPSIKILILSKTYNEHDAARSLLSGTDGYLLKDTCNSEMIKAVRSAYWGDIVTEPRVL